jgi:hypothetical protein
MAAVEIYTPTGVLLGTTAGVPLSNDGPDLESPVAVGDARWYPHDRGRPEQRGQLRVIPDEILLVVTDEMDMTVHMNWFPITLDVGPYRVTAMIATMPGFDPERALARPGGTYIPLREATIELLGRSDVAPAKRDHVHVNRYAVEMVSSSLMLGFFFPGARLAAPEPAPVA